MAHKLRNPSLLKDKAWINGAWIAGAQSFPVTNPADGSVVGNVPNLGVAETKQAIEAAEKALPAWSAKSARDRAAILRKWHDLMIENVDDLATIMTLEQGKPLAEAAGEIRYAAAFLEWFAEEGKRAYGDIIPSPIAKSRILVLKQPVGVCASITPWNFPSAMITRKVGPALAAGCTIVCKPAGETPLSALALAALAEEAGVPPGVVNIITSKDSRAVGKELCENKTVRKLSFTGSTEVGKTLMRQCADNVKKLSLELGGNAPFIVFEDADVDAAVAGAIICKYRNAGQTCVCANRIYVQESIYDEFAAKYVTAVKALRVGNGLEDGITIGPLINEAALEKVKEHITDAVKNGATVAVGGKPHKLGGSFFEPTVLTGVTKAAKISCEETFGPVAPLFSFKDEKEVIAQANDTEYGLASYFYAKDMARVWRVAEALEYGMVAVNTGILSTEVAPFGGIKESGTGREGSKYGLDEYVEMKYVLLAGL
ncbi:MAG: NAD-dependent succinate-semialdehyde dehydrogenase [Alphaproteobacteria bacterium]|nr:NAD-dependent succinate-semialdehyde dehydrogenase [Alphaproteobacteria bacterium]